MTDGRLGFSLVGFAVAAATVGVGTATGLAFVPLVGSYLGMLAGGFVAGLAIERRPLSEAGVAALLANLGILLVGSLDGGGVVAALSALVSLPPLSLATASALSFAVGAFGAHFGDDLREGLTSPVETRLSREQTPDGTPMRSTREERGVHDAVSDTEAASVPSEEGITDATAGSATGGEGPGRHSTGDDSGERESDHAESGDIELERES